MSPFNEPHNPRSHLFDGCIARFATITGSCQRFAVVQLPSGEAVASINISGDGCVGGLMIAIRMEHSKEFGKLLKRFMLDATTDECGSNSWFTRPTNDPYTLGYDLRRLQVFLMRCRNINGDMKRNLVRTPSPYQSKKSQPTYSPEGSGPSVA